MNNVSGFGTSSCSYSEEFAGRAAGLRKRITHHILNRRKLELMKSSGIELLTAASVGAVLMTAIYFFLIQLARYGW